MRHGPHHEAQMSNNRTFPAKRARGILRPCVSSRTTFE